MKNIYILIIITFFKSHSTELNSILYVSKCAFFNWKDFFKKLILFLNKFKFFQWNVKCMSENLRSLIPFWSQVLSGVLNRYFSSNLKSTKIFLQKFLKGINILCVMIFENIFRIFFFLISKLRIVIRTTDSLKSLNVC